MRPRGDLLNTCLWAGLAVLALGLPGPSLAAPAGPRITAFDRSGRLAWTNAPTPGICTVETSVPPGGNWAPGLNSYSITPTGAVTVTPAAPAAWLRLRAVEVPPTPAGFTNFIRAYGLLETLAGDGLGGDDTSYWQSYFEGWPGVYVSLSRPHYAMADRQGSLYIADKNSHSVLRLDTNGVMHTHAGTHLGGFNGEGPASATSLHLNFPNALWVRADGTVYVLDTDNARVRRVATNGVMTTLFYAKSDPSTPLGGGRCLWVRDDETLAYFGNTDRIRKWTPAGGLQTLASGFAELGTFYVEPGGDLVVADRGAHRVYRVTPAGVRTVIAGNGLTTGGGDGFPALQTGFNGPRGVWPIPTGGYLLLLHDGSQLWHIDAANTARLLVHGLTGVTHAGDGQYFYKPGELRISEGRSVTMDYAGNILLCESDYGYIRRIRFQRMPGF